MMKRYSKYFLQITTLTVFLSGCVYHYNKAPDNRTAQIKFNLHTPEFGTTYRFTPFLSNGSCDEEKKPLGYLPGFYGSTCLPVIKTSDITNIPAGTHISIEILCTVKDNRARILYNGKQDIIFKPEPEKSYEITIKVIDKHPGKYMLIEVSQLNRITGEKIPGSEMVNIPDILFNGTSLFFEHGDVPPQIYYNDK